jgi:hypothetical protein
MRKDAATMTETDPVAPRESPRAAASRDRRSAQKIAAERQRRQSLTKGVVAAVGAVVLIAVVAVAVNAWQQRQASIPDGVQAFGDVPVGHSAEPQTYAQNPPAGGVHDPVWQNCGYYPAPVRNENAVHSLEHGAVWITYQPDLPQEQVATLRSLAQDQSFILVSPMDGIPAPVVASAWGRQLQLNTADDERLQQFVRSFRLSPQAPEPGASCAGGTSETA